MYKEVIENDYLHERGWMMMDNEVHLSENWIVNSNVYYEIAVC